MQIVIRALLVLIAPYPVHPDTLVRNAVDCVIAHLANIVTQREVVYVTQQV